MQSLKGWNKPNKKTLLGPFRSWIYSKIFRSNRVKNVTLIKILL